jgi:hypothetical protein
MKKLLLILSLGACQGPDPVFVSASRQYYTAVNPEYLHYVDTDAALTAEQKARRHATADRFNEAITAREGK